MPYKSQAQQAYFNANRDKLEQQGVNVDEWNAASEGAKLPARVGKPKGKPKPRRNAAGYVPLTDLGM
jgi:hypothetical protein